MNRRVLIVTADDVGLHPGMTEGAVRAHREGIVTACSIVANGAAFDDAVARLRDAPSLEVGVHLTLVEERPLTAMRFPKKYTSFVPLYLARMIGIAAIERELRAQIERVLSTGLPVTHLNGHQHLHVLPRIFRVVVALAREYGIPYVRIVDESPPHPPSAPSPPQAGEKGEDGDDGRSNAFSARGARQSGVGVDDLYAIPLRPRNAGEKVPKADEGVARQLAIRALSTLGRRARTPGLTNDRTIGVAAAGHLGNIVSLLDRVEGITELVTHPGVAVSGYDWGYAWDAETRVLCDPRLREEIAKRGIGLTAPSHL